jgi:hypothetical protein
VRQSSCRVAPILVAFRLPSAWSRIDNAYSVWRPGPWSRSADPDSRAIQPAPFFAAAFRNPQPAVGALTGSTARTTSPPQADARTALEF